MQTFTVNLQHLTKPPGGGFKHIQRTAYAHHLPKSTLFYLASPAPNLQQPLHFSPLRPQVPTTIRAALSLGSSSVQSLPPHWHCSQSRPWSQPRQQSQHRHQYQPQSQPYPRPKPHLTRVVVPYGRTLSRSIDHTINAIYATSATSARPRISQDSLPIQIRQPSLAREPR